MKNKLSVIFVLGLILFVAIGCSLGGLTGGTDEQSSKDSSSSSSDAKSGDSKTEKEPSGEVVKVGITECDELATYINDNSEEIEGSIVARGIVYVYKNYVISKIKEGVENMSEKDKEEMAKVCAKSLDQLKKSMQK